jgi:hypothetical protein
MRQIKIKGKGRMLEDIWSEIKHVRRVEKNNRKVYIGIEHIRNW